LTADECCIVCG